MAYLMRGDEANQLTHQFVWQIHALDTLVQRTALGDIPSFDQRHHIMIPAYMCFDDFTTAGVYDTRPVCILRLRRQITHDGEPRIVHRHRGIIRPVLGRYGILKAGSFKSLVPIVDTCLQVRHPLLGRSGVNIEHDLLLGLNQFSSLIRFQVFGLQAVAGDDSLMFRSLLVLKLHDFGIEIAYPFITQTHLHRHLGQQYDTCCQTYRSHA